MNKKGDQRRETKRRSGDTFLRDFWDMSKKNNVYFNT